MSLEGRVALVAGASRGIGADIARHLARAGAKVAVAARTEVQSDPRLPGTIHSVAAEITAEGGTALPVVLNLRDPESITASVQRVLDEWGRLDILVTNAAIFVPGDLATVAPRHVHLSIDVNVRGRVLMMQAALPAMLAAGGGHIINVSGAGSAMPGPGPYTAPPPPSDVLYPAAEAFLDRFTQGQAWALQQHNISVNLLYPTGRVRTPGNIYAENDPQHPTLEVEPADDMGKAAVWIAQQPVTELTGSILIDTDIVREHNL
jgi:NAD(P)-dependent dehydrogenase (short-subunit alcohol dehydrogenase family)